MTRTRSSLEDEIDKLTERVDALDNNPVMQLVHSMAEERKRKKSNRRWLQRFVCDEQLR